jgi:hypothetical protein
VKTETETLQRVWYISSIDHTIRTLDKGRGDVIEQADEIPAVYDVVRGTRSKAWGKHSHHYLGYGHGDSPNAVLYRAGTLLNYAKLGRASELHGIPAHDMFGWSARFSIEHIRTKGLRGGLFQQFDGKYDRGCISLDYTPETLDEVIARFIGWCGATFETHEVRIDHKTVRVYCTQCKPAHARIKDGKCQRHGKFILPVVEAAPEETGS